MINLQPNGCPLTGAFLVSKHGHIQTPVLFNIPEPLPVKLCYDLNLKWKT